MGSSRGRTGCDLLEYRGQIGREALAAFQGHRGVAGQI